MANGDFKRQIVERLAQIQATREAVKRESVSRLVALAQTPVAAGGDLPLDTGFLRASLVATVGGLPSTRDAPKGKAKVSFSGTQIALALASWDFRKPLYVVYTAAYGRFVHYGARGHPGRPWVTLTAQQFPRIVREVAAEARASGGLK